MTIFLILALLGAVYNFVLAYTYWITMAKSDVLVEKKTWEWQITRLVLQGVFSLLLAVLLYSL